MLRTGSKGRKRSGLKGGPKRLSSPLLRAKEAAGFVVSEKLEILQFAGRTSPYLAFVPGKASLRLTAIVEPGLAEEIRKLIEQAKTQQSRVVKRDVPFVVEQVPRAVHIRVTPRREALSGRPSFEVLLQDAKVRTKPGEKAQAAPKIEGSPEREAAKLKHELAGLKETFAALLAEQGRKHEINLRKLKIPAHNLKEAKEKLEVIHAELEAANEELRAALAEREEIERRVRASEGYTRALLETASQGILAVGADGVIRTVNQTAERMFGYSREELLGHRIEILVPAPLRTAHMAHREEYFEQPRSRPMGEGLDLLAQRKDGTTFPVEISLSHIETAGEIVAVAFVSDISERKRSEAETRLQAEITANMTEGVCMVESRGSTFAYANERFERLFGYAPGDLQGQAVTVLNAGGKKQREATAREIIQALKRTGTWAGEIQNVRKDGTSLWCRYNVFTMKHAQHGTVWVGVCSDVTQQRDAEEALRTSQRELRSLAARLISVQEDQYKHLSRELHDAFSQKLAALSMGLAALRKQLPPAQAAVKQRLQETVEQAAGLADDLQRVSRRLHPSILDDLGIEAALHREGMAFAQQQGVQVSFEAENVPEPVPEDIKLCFYRLTQESLTNIGRHSRAQQVHIALRGRAGELVLSIVDAGDGFDLEAVRGKGGLGLVSMDERVRLIGGTLVIESQPGKGTKVEVRAPLKRPQGGRPRR